MTVTEAQKLSDQLDVQILWNRIITLVEEQARSLMRSAFSPALSDGADLSAAIFDTKGDMIAQAVTGTPGHVNVTGKAVKEFLRRYQPDLLYPGDVLVSNDPYGISGHLLDVTVATPIFRENELIAIVASTCHTVDMGGLGFTTEARSTFEEGLYLPYLKLYNRGTMSGDIRAILDANVRSPHEVLGDLSAQVTGNHTASEGLLELMDEFDLAELDSFGQVVMGKTEAVVRRAISEAPDGIYRKAISLDGPEGDVTLAVSVGVRGKSITVDFDGSSAAVGRGFNVPLAYAEAYTIWAIKAALAPDVPNNEGSFRPIVVKAPSDCIVNATHPQPTQGRHLFGQAVGEVVLNAIAEAVPEHVIAESGATPLWVLYASGEDRAGDTFTFMAFTSGGMGASAKSDGLSATIFPSGARGTPVEIIEATSPVFVLRKELRTDSGGPGRYRGGCGQEVALRVTTGRAWKLPTMFGRCKSAAAGIQGGRPGSLGEALRGATEKLNPMDSYVLGADDIVTLRLPGGGGYGDPREREAAAVEDDVLNGYVSPVAAAEVYGAAVQHEDH